MRLKRLPFVACVAALCAIVGAQQPDYEVRILSPEDGAYATGQWALRAAIVPTPSVPVRVFFMVDNQIVCAPDDTPPYECAWDAGPGLRRHEIVAVAEFTTGRKLRAVAHTKEVDFNVNVDRVRLAVSVTAHGHYVDGLPRDAFQIHEDGAPQPLSLFLQQNVPLDLVVAVDISASMTPCMPAVREAVKGFIRALRPTDRVSGLVFNSDSVVLFGADKDLDAKCQAVDLLEPWGMTSLYDVLASALDKLDANEPGRDARRALVVFSDGDDTFSHLNQQDVEERVERSEASLYLIAQGEGVHTGRLKQVLERLAERSGGIAFFPENVKKLPGVFNEIVEALAHQYLLGYEPKGDDYKWHKVRVTVRNDSYRVRAKQGRRRPMPARK